MKRAFRPTDGGKAFRLNATKQQGHLEAPPLTDPGSLTDAAAAVTGILWLDDGSRWWYVLPKDVTPLRARKARS